MAVGRRWKHPLLPTRDTLHTLRSFPRVDGEKAAAELGHRPRALETTLRDSTPA